MLRSCMRVNNQLWKGCYSPRILKSSAVSEYYATVANGAEQSNTSKAPRARNVYRMPAETRFTDAYQEYFNSMPAQSTSKYTQHPGAALNKPIKPPPNMMQAAVKLLQQYSIPNREADVKKLKNYLSERRIPTEDSDLNSLAQKIEKEITRKKLEKTETRDLTQEELEEYMADVKRQTKKKLRNQVYHWKPIEMDAFTSLVYMSSNLLSNYAMLYSIMNEIAKIDAQFQPKSMLDFGSGLATSVWAANAIWKDSISEHYCWDKSGDICTLARLLLQEAEEYDDMIYPGVYFRQQLERRDLNQQAGFDLVICSHSLFELPNKQTRLQYIDKLWDQTVGYLIITDIGTPRGHQIVEEARMHLIEKNNESEENRASVFSPCPHDSPCPRLKQKFSCSFQASYATGVNNRSKLLYEAPPVQAERKKKTIKGTSTRFSYVVLKKGQLPDTERLPRLIDRVTENTPSCMQCNICYPDGQVRLTNVTRRETIVPFRLVKNSAWGSRLPLVDWESIAEQHQTSNHTATSDLDLKHLSENSEPDDEDNHNVTNIDNENTDSLMEDYEAELSDGGDNLTSRESFKLPTSEKCDCGNDGGLCDNRT